MAIQERYPGLEQINLGCATPGTSVNYVLEQLEWFATEVMPTFKNQAKAPSAS